MKTENIGTNAGVVWRTLRNSDSEMSIKALTDATGLDVIAAAAAIGWLARENKIIIKETQDGCLLTVFKECYY